MNDRGIYNMTDSIAEYLSKKYLGNLAEELITVFIEQIQKQDPYFTLEESGEIKIRIPLDHRDDPPIIELAKISEIIRKEIEFIEKGQSDPYEIEIMDVLRVDLNLALQLISGFMLRAKGSE